MKTNKNFSVIGKIQSCAQAKPEDLTNVYIPVYIYVYTYIYKHTHTSFLTSSIFMS